MSNFGEAIGYWYLRLNGFFPLSNFVLHGYTEASPGASADVDILAIRPPYVREEIGGQVEDWDNDRFEGWGLSLRGESLLALIVEVKTGGYSDTPNKVETREGLQRSVARLGICTLNTVGSTSAELVDAASADADAGKIGKLLVTARNPPGDRFNSWNQLSLRDALEFVKNRVGRYPTEKERDRLLFGDTLMQYLAWERAGQE